MGIVNKTYLTNGLHVNVAGLAQGAESVEFYMVSYHKNVKICVRFYYFNNL